MINLPDLADRLSSAKLLNKTFMECTREEIEKLCEAVVSCPEPKDVPEDGWVKPYFTDFGSGPRLVIPFGSHPAYHWWKPTGKSLAEILIEFDAPFEVAREYIANLTEERWKQKLKPF